MKRPSEAVPSVHVPDDVGDEAISFKKRFKFDNRLVLESGGLVVYTESFKEVMEKLDIAVQVDCPIIIEGEASVGKSTLLEAYASIKNKEFVLINVGEQTDAKALIGVYVTDDVNPGSFKWVPGLLTEAVRKGTWIIFEDIHLASVEILSTLQPVLESKMLFNQSTGERITAPKEFRVFATKGLTEMGPSSFESTSANLWLKLQMQAPSLDELLTIIKTKYPNMEPLAEIILRLYEKLQILAFKRNLQSLFSLCSRLDSYFSSKRLEVQADGFDEATRELLLLEAYDVNGSHLAKVQDRIALLECLCEVLYLPISDAILNREPSIVIHDTQIQVGRVALPRLPLRSKGFEIAPTKLSKQIIERIAYAVHLNNPVLLVGETGTGKTTLVQELAKATGHSKLIVINMSHQTEVSDLIGGFRPLSPLALAKPIFEKFECLFMRSALSAKNTAYLQEVLVSFQKQNWSRFVKLLNQVIQMLEQKVGNHPEWSQLKERVDGFSKQVQFLKTNILFGFVEGALVEAIREGHWLLLDEINLASSETLEILSGLLRSKSSSIFLNERGDKRPVERHPNFRLFACMNPATDVSKKDLPPSIRYKFTELYVDETDLYEDDLKLVIEHILGPSIGGIGKDTISTVYYQFKEAVNSHVLVDGSNRKPLLNLRTLSRALKFSKKVQSLYGFQRALFEGFCLAFVTTLGERCKILALEILTTGLGLKMPLPVLRPNKDEVSRFAAGKAGILVDGYFVGLGLIEPASDLSTKFVLTPSVKQNVAQLTRAIMAGGHPILLEGPTSSGKTSVVEYLALMTGHKFVRINNHEHTDIQEYIGAYQPDANTGRLVFKDGLLVEALKNGYWLVLDELNLAPSDVLEALNRLLDDNRELFLPETNETIKPHPDFLLFATQNPVGSYGGRKALSRAFRSRFLELQFDDLPVDEVEVIISKRCSVAPSHAKKIAKIYRVLQEKRQSATNMFAGRHALITLRDLFRWANRDCESIEQLAENGYLVLAERIRHEEDKVHIKAIIESVCKCKIQLETIYDLRKMAKERKWPIDIETVFANKTVTWTKAMQRTFALVYQCYLAGESVLLVGETGCGKTTAVQVLSEILGNELKILNCHQNTETADLLGCLRPCRDKGDEGKMFTWYDGPLVQCMKSGHLLLLDEISLADDSVLERLNSVLEPQGKLVLAEHIGLDSAESQTIAPVKGFSMFSTMNPGGDYGKKELSPALRNRFTEIWVPSIGDSEDLTLIVNNLVGPVHAGYHMGEKIVNFLNWWQALIKDIPFLNRWIVSLRDVIMWARFCSTFGSQFNLDSAFIHAATMLFIDPASSRCQREDAEDVLNNYKKACLLKLVRIIGRDGDIQQITAEMNLEGRDIVINQEKFGIEPFFIASSDLTETTDFAFSAPTTFASAFRILRAMQLGSSILLEGSPGVGKTTLVNSIAQASGHNLVRINLSDQTDLIDLFGTDLPVEGGALGQFQWCDGPFLRALKNGDWILLDELNLASQSVLEGLNACLDHRGSVYIPELNMTFKVSTNTRIFAAQNPVKQGGGRKGLPKSFVNRFITVWFDQLSLEDYKIICCNAFKNLSTEFICKAIEFNKVLIEAIQIKKEFGGFGRPWEFNLRDLFRWLNLAQSHPEMNPAYFFRTIYYERMRKVEDRKAILSLFESIFGKQKHFSMTPYQLDNELKIGAASIPVNGNTELQLSRFQLGALESLVLCLEKSWMSIIVGASGSGKTSMIRLLAQLSGTKCVEFSMGPDTDTLELLGSFEQVNFDKKYRLLAQKYGLSSKQQMADAEMSGLKEEFEALQVQEENLKGAFFEWVDGPLTVALTQGHWIVLDNPNLCNPAVLDRLNSLFEPNGYLTLDEASGSSPRILRPHKNFRLFMTLDPRFGELSRAMRNRGIEIALCHTEPLLFDRIDISSSKSLELTVQLKNQNLRTFDRAMKVFNVMKSRNFEDALDKTIEFLGLEKQETVINDLESFWLDGQIPASITNAKSEFLLQIQTILLSKWLSHNQDPLTTIPAILTYLSWSSEEDLDNRISYLKGIYAELMDNVDLQNCCSFDVMELFGQVLNQEYEGKKASIAMALFKTKNASSETILSTVAKLNQPISLNKVQSSMLTDWQLKYIWFGYANAEYATLFSRLDSLMQVASSNSKVVDFYLDLIILNDSQEAMDLESAHSQVQELESNFIPKDSFEEIMSPLFLLDSFFALLNCRVPTFGTGFDGLCYQLLCSNMHEKIFAEQYARNHLLKMITQLPSDNVYSELSVKIRSLITSRKVCEIKKIEILLGKLKACLSSIMNNSVEISEAVKDFMKIDNFENLIADASKKLSIFADNLFDPVLQLYKPKLEISQMMLRFQISEVQFQHLFQAFYFGVTENYSHILDMTERQISENEAMVRYRADSCSTETIQEQLKLIENFKGNSEHAITNLTAIYNRLEKKNQSNPDLLIGPLSAINELMIGINLKGRPSKEALEMFSCIRKDQWTHSVVASQLANSTSESLALASVGFLFALVSSQLSQNTRLISAMLQSYAALLNSDLKPAQKESDEDVPRLFSNQKDNNRQRIIMSGQLMSQLVSKSIKPVEIFNQLSELIVNCQIEQFSSPRTLLQYAFANSSSHICDGNVFSHICPVELEKMVNAVAPLSNRIEQFLVEYPENDIFQNIQMQLEKLLNKPVQSESFLSIANLLENILNRAHVWESHSKNSEKLQPQLAPIQELLHSWRLKELQSWKQFSTIIKDRHRSEAFSNWSLVTSVLYSSSNPADLVGFLDTFIICGPIGEFEYRLELLQQISNYPDIPSSLCVLVKNCIKYFGLYEEGIIEHLKSLCKPIFDDLNGFLASLKWNDKSIINTLESTQKVHNFVIKSYKSLSEIQQQSTSSVLNKINVDKVNVKDELKPVETTLPSLEAVTSMIFERMDDLTKNSSKDSVKLKQQALVDLFKLLKSIGLRLYQNVPENMSSVNALLLSLPDLALTGNDSGYALKCVHLWSSFEQSLQSPHEDNNVRQVSIFKTSLHQLLYRLSSYLNHLSMLKHQSVKLEDLIRLFNGRLIMSNPVLIEREQVLNIVEICQKLAAKVHESRIFAEVKGDPECDLDELLNAAIILLDHFNVEGDLIIEMDTLNFLKELVSAIPDHDEVSILIAELQRSILNLRFATPLTGSNMNFPELPSSLLPEYPVINNDFEVCDNLLDLYSSDIECVLKVAPVDELESFRSAILNSDQIQLLEKSQLVLASHLSQHDYLSKKLAKFIYILGTVFKNIVKDGFCKPPETSEVENKDEKTGELEEGTGMAEGQGEKDVSNEIEFEEQITGLENEEANEEEQKEDSGEGLDMSQDFDAQLEDLMLPSDEEDEEDGDKKDDDNVKDQFGENDDASQNDDHEMDVDKEEKGTEDESKEPEKAETEMDKLENPEKSEFTEAEKQDQLEGSSNEYGSEDEDQKMGSDNENHKEEIDDSMEQDDITADSSGELEEDEEMKDGTEEAGFQEDVLDVHDVDDQADDMDVDDADQKDETIVSKPKNELAANEDTGNEDQASKGEESNDNIGEQSNNDTSIQQKPSGNDEFQNEIGPSLPTESKAKQPNSAETLESLMDNINRSVHSILEKDKSIEGSQSIDMELSLQQMYQQTDDQNGVGLVTGAQEVEALMDKIVTKNKDMADDMDETEDAAEALDEESTEMSKSKKVFERNQDLMHMDTEDLTEQNREDVANWDQIESEVFPLAMELCEQLRLVLEPTKASKLKGDYRTGKRLNLRKLIPYIISQYRKDKIWLRRTKPNKRTYRISLSIDNSKSMKDNSCDVLALKTVSMLSQALTRLEAGKISVVGFGDEAKVIVPFSDVPFGSDSGKGIVESLRFNDETTDMLGMLQSTLDLFASDSDGDGVTWDLNIIISDGVCHDHKRMQQLLNESMAKRIVNIFVILDTKPASESILEMSRVDYIPIVDSKGILTGETTIKMRKYLETFPFENYVVVRDVSHLPQILSDSIRQWFELITSFI